MNNTPDDARRRNDIRRALSGGMSTHDLRPGQNISSDDYDAVMGGSFDRLEDESIGAWLSKSSKSSSFSSSSTKSSSTSTSEGNAALVFGLIVIAIIGWIINNIAAIATSLAVVAGMLVSLGVVYYYLPQAIGSWRSSRAEGAMLKLDPNALSYRNDILRVVRHPMKAAEFSRLAERYEELRGAAEASGMDAHDFFQTLLRRARSDHPDPIHRAGRPEGDLLDETPLKKLSGVYAGLLAMLVVLRMAKASASETNTARIDAMIIVTLDLLRKIGISKRSAWTDAHPKNWALST